MAAEAGGVVGAVGALGTLLPKALARVLAACVILDHCRLEETQREREKERFKTLVWFNELVSTFLHY